MQKIRINDLARELEVKSKMILDALIKVGVTEKKTHSSSIEVDEAERVKKYFAEHAEPGATSRLVAHVARRIQAQAGSFAHLQTGRCAEGGHATGRPAFRGCTSGRASDSCHTRRASPNGRAALSRSSCEFGYETCCTSGERHASNSCGTAQASAPFHYASVGRAPTRRHRYSTEAAGSRRLRHIRPARQRSLPSQ